MLNILFEKLPRVKSLRSQLANADAKISTLESSLEDSRQREATLLVKAERDLSDHVAELRFAAGLCEDLESEKARLSAMPYDIVKILREDAVNIAGLLRELEKEPIEKPKTPEYFLAS